MSPNPQDAPLWSLMADMARDGLDAVTAFRKLRTSGGRDICKTDDEFKAIYEQFVSKPLFARNTVLQLKRSKLQEDLRAAYLAIDVDHDDLVDEVLEDLRAFDTGDFRAMLRCMDRIRVHSPAVASSLEETARMLWPKLYAQHEAIAEKVRAASNPSSTGTQLELPFSAEPERNQDLPDVPA